MMIMAYKWVPTLTCCAVLCCATRATFQTRQQLKRWRSLLTMGSNTDLLRSEWVPTPSCHVMLPFSNHLLNYLLCGFQQRWWDDLPCRAVLCRLPGRLPCRLPCLAMLCHAVPCHAMPCRAVPCRAVPCHAVLCRAVPCCAMPCRAETCRATAHSISADTGLPRHSLTIYLIDDAWRRESLWISK